MNGPRLSVWQLVQAISLPNAGRTMRGDWAVRQVDVGVPCGLWQSEQRTAPSFTR